MNIIQKIFGTHSQNELKRVYPIADAVMALDEDMQRLSDEELKAKTSEQLELELVSAKKELFNLRFQNATNQLNNTARIREVRRNIARIQTVLTQKKAAE